MTFRVRKMTLETVEPSLAGDSSLSTFPVLAFLPSAMPAKTLIKEYCDVCAFHQLLNASDGTLLD